MLRIRFHGRGGQGMKTASRILGSAAFRAGFVVQDAPVYGAERRGAPMAAFTRLARHPILERGAITQADLVVVADDTLLSDPAAQPLAGCAPHSSVLLNTAKTAAAVAALAAWDGPLWVADFTALAFATTQALASLSTALGVAACALAGLSLPDSLRGVQDELASAPLSPEQQRSNVELATAAYALASAWPPLQERPEAPEPAISLVQPHFVPPSQAAPSIYAVANSPQRHTGTWRQFRPVLQQERCTRCWLCFVWCPEAAISLNAEDYPVIDYDVCKGCLLCAHECPTQAFHVEKEAR